MSQKTLSRKYYLGIRKTLIVFVLATFICMTFKSINLVPAAKTAFEHFDLCSAYSVPERSAVSLWVVVRFRSRCRIVSRRADTDRSSYNT